MMALDPTGSGLGLKPDAAVFHIIFTGCVGFKLDSGPVKQNDEQFGSAEHIATASANVAVASGLALVCGPQPEPPLQHSPPFSTYAAPGLPL